VKEVLWGTGARATLAAKVEGGQDLERRFHLHFIEHWIGREWFAASPEMDRVIAAINDGSFDTDELPPVRPLPRSLLWRRINRNDLAIHTSPAPSSRAGAKAAFTGSAPCSPVGAADLPPELANLGGLAATVRLSPLSSPAVAGGFSA
jgi:hypothetical protein